MSGITGDTLFDVEGDAIQIEGGTDQTRIGNVGDAVKVNITNPIQVSPLPSLDLNYTVVDLKATSGSNDMVVNGSTAPIEFIFQPIAGDIFYVTEIQIYLSDGGNPAEDDFGQIAGGITNGLLVENKVNGSTATIYNLKNNIDLSVAFRISPERSQFLTDKNFIGFRIFDPNLKLDGDDGDFLKATVRDDLTNLNSLRISLFGFRVV